MPSNEVLAARCQYLMQAIHFRQSSTKHINNDFKDNAKSASDAIDKALHANNLKTIEDLAQEVAKQIPEKDRADFLKLIAQNKLPTVWESLIGKDAAGHITKATQFLGSMVALNGAVDIKAGLSFDMRLGFSYVSSFARASALRVAATDAFAAHVAKVADIAALERDIALQEIVGTQATQLRAELQVAMNEELVIAGESYSLRTAAFAAEGAAGAAETDLLAARAAARSSLKAGVYGALIGVGILLGCWAYSEYEAKKQAGILKDAIGKLAASRLFAQSILHKAEVFAGLMNDIGHIADHYSPDPNTYKSRLEDLIGDLRKKQVDDLPKAFEELQNEDKTAQPPTDTSEDPKTIEELTKIHEQEMKEYLEKHPETPMVQK